ncbi:MDR family MFS transporter [Anaerotardibacter muris]|uniref:MDR family MFS transporter n=1 Tax=Anaerotardibacter muris TaxID=2941505 RepID=UPI0020412F5F|nr:MDR family MFS transporter [Anaerotardibacter muris]
MGLTRNQVKTVAVLLIGTFVVVLNQTLLSPALASIMRDLQIDAPTVQWVMSIYSLVEAVIIPLSAYLIGRFSTRQLFITGLIIFTAGSLLCAFSPGFPFLLLGRVCQAIAAGIFMPMIFTVLLLIFPREKRGSAMGLVSLVIGFAPAVGPTLSGILVDSIGWRMLFVVITCVGVLLILAAAKFLENYGDFERTTFDKLSVVLSTIGLVCLLYGLSTFSSTTNPAMTAGFIVVGLVVIAIFVRRQLKLKNPLLKVSVLKTRNYRIAIIVAIINFGVLIGLGTILPLYLQNLRGFTALETGLTLLPGALIGAIIGYFSGRLFDRWGVRKCVVPGVTIFFVGTLGFLMFDMNTDLLVICAIYTVVAFGIQFLTTPMNTWGINSLDNSVIQHANAVTNTLNQVSAAFMTALIVSISALGSVIAPGADPVTQLYEGDHLAFLATAVLAAIAFIVVIAFVRDKKTANAHIAPKSMQQFTPAEDPDKIPVSRAMNTDPYFVTSSASIREVAQIMVENKTGGVSIVDNNKKVVGFISDGDIMKYIGRDDGILDSTYMLYQVPDPQTFPQRVSTLIDMNVMKIATKSVIAVTSTSSLEDACRLLSEKRIKKVPVVEDGNLVGSLSRSDVIRATMANIVTIKAMAEKDDERQSHNQHE